MLYFQQFPRVLYTLTPGTPPVVSLNIMARAKIRQVVRQNAFIMYPYSIKDSDTPEIIAAKYYGDPNRWWIVLAANDICDPWYDWPLNYDAFQEFISGKYGTIASAQGTIHHYEKWIARTDSVTGVTTTAVLQIPLDVYNSLPSTQTTIIHLTNGSTVTQVTTTNTVTQWDYEYNLNEAKRLISLIDKQFVGQLESELKTVFA